MGETQSKPTNSGDQGPIRVQYCPPERIEVRDSRPDPQNPESDSDPSALLRRAQNEYTTNPDAPEDEKNEEITTQCSSGKKSSASDNYAQYSRDAEIDFQSDQNLQTPGTNTESGAIRSPIDASKYSQVHGSGQASATPNARGAHLPSTALSEEYPLSSGVLVQGIRVYDADGRKQSKRVISYLPPRPYLNLMDPTSAAPTCAQIQKHSWELDSMCIQRQSQLAIAMDRLEISIRNAGEVLTKYNQGYIALLYNLQDIDLVLKFCNTLTMKLAKAVVQVNGALATYNSYLSIPVGDQPPPGKTEETTDTPVNEENLPERKLPTPWKVDVPIPKKLAQSGVIQIETFLEFQARLALERSNRKVVM